MPVYIKVPGLPECCKGKGMEEALRWLSRHGLHDEVQFNRQVYMSPQEAKEIGELAESLKPKVKLSVHAPYYINLANPEKVAASKKRILDSADRAERMNADIVVFHPGFYGDDKKKAFERVLKACKEMAKKTPVPLGLETMGRQKQFGTIEECVQIAREVKGCVPVVDFAHVYARQNGQIDYADVFERLKSLKLKHYHTHFVCVAYGPPGNERHHLPLSAKEPDFKPLAQLIKKKNFDTSIVCESPLLEIDALKMLKYF